MSIVFRKKNRQKKWLIRLFIFLLATSLALTVDTRSASAHAFLLRTDPADGSVLASAPKQIRLWFSESLEVNLTNITLQDGKNKTWQLKPYADSADPAVVIVDLPELLPNAYRVNWRTVSDEDLHITSGSIVFGIQQAVSREASAQAQSTAPFSEAAFHWINLLAFAAIIGTLINLFFLFPRIKGKIQNEQSLKTLSALQRKIISLAFWCSVIAFVAGLCLLWSKSLAIQSGAASILNINWDLIAGNIYIKRELASEACLIVIAFLIFYLMKQGDKNITINNFLLFAFVILWAVLQSLNSHASAFNHFSPTRVLAYAFHLLGAGMWIGGQITLIFFIAPRLRTRNEDYALARAIYVRFGGIAAIGVATLIVTGLYSAGQQVASLDALLLTAYGQSLVFKSIFVILTGLIGLWHSSLFHPKVARILFKIVPQKIVRMIFGKANLPVTLRLQLLGGVAIFLLAAFMSSTQPARGPEFDPPAQVQAPAVSQQPFSSMANDLLVNFAIKPNQPGQNFINVGVFDTRRPSPGPIEEVVVKLQPPGKQTAIQMNAVPAGSNGKGNYQISTGDIQISGAWRVSLIIKRAGLDDATMELPWTVMSSAPIVTTRSTFISSHPLAPLLTLASLILSLLIVCAWGVVTLRPKLFNLPDSKVGSTSQEINL